MKICATCGMDVEHADFSVRTIERLPPDLTVTEFRSTTPLSRGFGCTQCKREWDIHGELLKDV